MVAFKKSCGPCHGSGYYGANARDMCLQCHGLGEVEVPGENSDYRNCNRCHSSGYYGADCKDTCQTCGGLGIIGKSTSVKARVTSQDTADERGKSSMNSVQDLRVHVDALLSAMESEKKFFAAVVSYVKELARVVRLPRTEVTKPLLATPTTQLIQFYTRYIPSTPGSGYISPVVISNTKATVQEISDLVTKLTSLSDDEFATRFPPSGRAGAMQHPSGIPKPPAIFIGHGRSKEWLELEKYLTKDLHLNCEEFNAQPAAGYTTQQRLKGMLDKATFAFLVMTAEEKYEDGTVHARENVVHEAGLFQGRLGIPNAVLLVESGCEAPSNISGLTHIGFPKGNISAAFHEVRRVLGTRRIIDT
jgi:hypothetical protein